MLKIHPTAIVHPGAELGRNVEIGPFCVIEDRVVIGDECQLASHVVVKSGTRMGCGNQIAEAAILGGSPQHSRAGAETGGLQLGDRNILREHVTIHRGLGPGDWTRLGNENMIMVNTHIAHDCHVGNQTVMVNNVMLAGHVTVGDRAYFGGAVGVHQFCRIGRLAMLGGQAHVSQDVPPFVMLDGITTEVVGLNVVGLRRAGLSRDEIQSLKDAYRVIYRSGLMWKDVLEVLSSTFTTGPAAEFHPFLSHGSRGFVQERKTPRGATIKLGEQASSRATLPKAA